MIMLGQMIICRLSVTTTDANNNHYMPGLHPWVKGTFCNLH
jgi:hypothetical protein